MKPDPPGQAGSLEVGGPGQQLCNEVWLPFRRSNQKSFLYSLTPGRRKPPPPRWKLKTLAIRVSRSYRNLCKPRRDSSSLTRRSSCDRERCATRTASSVSIATMSWAPNSTIKRFPA
jgi:hypothetical protein